MNSCGSSFILLLFRAYTRYSIKTNPITTILKVVILYFYNTYHHWAVDQKYVFFNFEKRASIWDNWYACISAIFWTNFVLLLKNLFLSNYIFRSKQTCYSPHLAPRVDEKPPQKSHLCTPLNATSISFHERWSIIKGHFMYSISFRHFLIQVNCVG